MKVRPWTSLMALAVITSHASAAVVFFEDFEDDTLGSAPSIGGSNIGAANTVTNGIVPVVANPEAHGNTSSQVAQAGGNTVNFNRLFGTFAGGSQLIDGMTITFDFYHGNSGADNNDSIRLGFSDNGTAVDALVRFDPDGNNILVDGNDQGAGDFGIGVWQRYSSSFTQISSGNYTVAWTLTNLETSASISGSQAVTTDSFADPDSVLGTAFLLVDPNNGDDYLGYIDNLTVTAVPEPSALVLCSLVGGGLFLHRRRAE